jgi:hypothetical protein
MYTMEDALSPIRMLGLFLVHNHKIARNDTVRSFANAIFTKLDLYSVVSITQRRYRQPGQVKSP